MIQSVLAQDSVDSVYSGALITFADGSLFIEAARGFGDKLMQGRQSPEKIVPASVKSAVTEIYEQAREFLGPVRMEWAHDGTNVWALQLHIGLTKSIGRTIVAGDPPYWHRFEVEQGLEALGYHLDGTIWGQHGIILVGDVGVTSHFADILRRAGVPSRIEPKQN